MAIYRWNRRPGADAQYVLRYEQSGVVTDTFVVFAVPTGLQMRVSSGNGNYTAEDMLRSDAYAAPDGSVWTMAQTNYSLEQHDTSGMSRKLFGVRVAGAPEPIMRLEDVKDRQRAGQRIPTRSVVRSTLIKRRLQPHNWIDIDSAGLLWVTRQIAAPLWDTISPGQKFDPNEAPQEEIIPREIEDRLYHTVIEVIDPRVGQLLTRLTLPFMGERVSAGYVGRVKANADGYFQPTVYRLEFKRP